MNWEPPKVQRGIPIPPAPSPRKVRRKREYKPSPWVAFLKTLKDGDSFEVGYSEGATVRKYLLQLNITHEYRWLGGGQHGRIWILNQPWKPEYSNIGLDI